MDDLPSKVRRPLGPVCTPILEYSDVRTEEYTVLRQREFTPAK